MTNWTNRNGTDILERHRLGSAPGQGLEWQNTALAAAGHTPQDARVENHRLTDKTRVKTQCDIVWMALAMMVSACLWLVGTASKHMICPCSIV
jgi:hypothetical protein